MKHQPPDRRLSRSRRSLLRAAGSLRPAPRQGGPADNVDWAEVLLLANEHLIAPAMFAALRRNDRLSELPAEVRAYLGRLYRLNRMRNRSLRAQALQLIGAFNDRNVPAMVLKGAATLFDQAAREPAARMIRDIDLMVREASLSTALSILERLGYRVANRYPPGHNAHAELIRPGDAGAVDLHIAPLDAPYLFGATEMWQRAWALDVEGARAWLPHRDDRILHNILHAQIHYLGGYYRGEIELRQVHDLVRLAGADDAVIDWRRIEARMRGAGLGTALESYLLTAHRLFGLAWPLSRPPGWRAAIHHRRCIIQILSPGIARAALPWGNIRSALAGHRMRARYGDASSPLLSGLRHTWRIARRRRLDQVLARVMRTE